MKKLLSLLLVAALCISFSCSSDSDDPDIPEVLPEKEIVLSHTSNKEAPVSLTLIGDHVTIDWGDGVVETYENLGKIDPDKDDPYYWTFGEVSHTYEKEGQDYEIKISTDELYLLSIHVDILRVIKVGYCPYLEYLTLTERWENDKITETLDLRFCKELKELKIEGLERLLDLNIKGCSKLELLYIRDADYLSELDLSKNIKLTNLEFHYTEIQTLDLSKNVDLDYLHIYYNELTSLDVSKNKELRTLWADGNKIEGKIDLSGNKHLFEIHLSSNKIEEVDLTGCTSLSEVYLYDNNLSATALDKMFHTLPILSEWRKASISISHNPGVKDCDPNIARDKGWRVIY